MVCLGLKPGAAGWQVQTNPLSYGGTPLYDFLGSKYSDDILLKTVSKSALKVSQFTSPGLHYRYQISRSQRDVSAETKRFGGSRATNKKLEIGPSFDFDIGPVYFNAQVSCLVEHASQVTSSTEFHDNHLLELKSSPIFPKQPKNKLFFSKQPKSHEFLGCFW